MITMLIEGDARRNSDLKHSGIACFWRSKHGQEFWFLSFFFLAFRCFLLRATFFSDTNTPEQKLNAILSSIISYHRSSEMQSMIFKAERLDSAFSDTRCRFEPMQAVAVICSAKPASPLLVQTIVIQSDFTG